MRTYDLTPLFRQSVGFDTLNRMLDSALKWDESAPAYPPYNIEKRGEDAYRITLAVAGFGADDLTLTSQENSLVIAGKQATPEPAAGDYLPEYLHRGIAARAFERRFHLADHVKVTDAQLENGLLHVSLVREVPEAMKPRTIKVQTGGGTKTIDQKAA